MNYWFAVPKLSLAGTSQIIEEVTDQVQQECRAEGASCIPYFQICCDPYECIFSGFTPGTDGKKIPNYKCKQDKV